MFTVRIAYSADFYQSQVPRTKRYLLYLGENEPALPPNSDLSLDNIN